MFAGMRTLIGEPPTFNGQGRTVQRLTEGNRQLRAHRAALRGRCRLPGMTTAPKGEPWVAPEACARTSATAEEAEDFRQPHLGMLRSEAHVMAAAQTAAAEATEEIFEATSAAGGSNRRPSRE